MYQRALQLNDIKKSFFLWGQRQTGKSSLLKAAYPQAPRIDLLRSEQFLEYSARPSLLRERFQNLPRGSRVIIDEVQKVPLLLDEAHALIEDRGLAFALCGSSARKLIRGKANLLGGRAWKFELFGVTSHELGKDFELERILNRGYLPSHYGEDRFDLSLKSYVADYLKEEVLAEGLIRNIPIFSRFLEAAAFSDGQILNYSNIARECGVSPKTAQSYFEILSDTLIGSFLPAYTRRAKRRTVHSPKFYFHDVGIVNSLLGRRSLGAKTPEFGHAFENWIAHELRCFLKYRQRDESLSYWQLSSGVEVDFIFGDMEVAVEAKSSSRITEDALKGLRELKADFPKVRERIVVCQETQPRITHDGIIILPYAQFTQRLWGIPESSPVSFTGF
jgi:uncharacterized protein